MGNQWRGRTLSGEQKDAIRQLTLEGIGEGIIERVLGVSSGTIQRYRHHGSSTKTFHTCPSFIAPKGFDDVVDYVFSRMLGGGISCTYSHGRYYVDGIGKTRDWNAADFALFDVIIEEIRERMAAAG